MLADIRYAIRQLLKNPGYTSVAVLTLALGIGVNTTTFTLLNTLLFKPAPFGGPSRLVYIYSTSPQSKFWDKSPAQVRDLRSQNTVFESFAALSRWEPSLAEPGQPAERLKGISVSEGFFPMLRIAPAVGRLYTPEEERDGGVVDITNRLWQRRLGGDAQAVGRILRLDGKPFTVVGVMPPSLDDPMTWGRLDLWAPLAYRAGSWNDRNSNDCGGGHCAWNSPCRG